MSDSASSTPRDHVAIHKLDVARERIVSQLLCEISNRQWDSAHGLIHELRGLSVAEEVLLAPDASFDAP